LQYVDNTTKCFDGAMVQIREFLINARQRSVADQTSEQAQGGVPFRSFFRDPEQRKGIPRLYQTLFVTIALVVSAHVRLQSGEAAW